MKDVEGYEDIHKIITQFYKKGIYNELIGPIFFSRIPAEVWDEHMEKITQFWCGIVFQTMGYSGRPFPPHTTMGLTQAHFDQWLFLFHETVSENYFGPKADHMHNTAENIAKMFMARIDNINNSLAGIDILG
jgi:hemoglobin